MCYFRYSPRTYLKISEAVLFSTILTSPLPASGDPEKSGRKEQVDKIIKFHVKIPIIWIMKAKKKT